MGGAAGAMGTMGVGGMAGAGPAADAGVAQDASSGASVDCAITDRDGGVSVAEAGALYGEVDAPGVVPWASDTDARSTEISPAGSDARVLEGGSINSRSDATVADTRGVADAAAEAAARDVSRDVDAAADAADNDSGCSCTLGRRPRLPLSGLALSLVGLTLALAARRRSKTRR
jgi:hypothetical protein